MINVKLNLDLLRTQILLKLKKTTNILPMIIILFFCYCRICGLVLELFSILQFNEQAVSQNKII